MTAKYRRSVSMNPETFLRLESLAEHEGLPLARVAESLIVRAHAEAGLPDVPTSHVEAMRRRMDSNRRPLPTRNAKRLARRREVQFGPQSELCRHMPCVFCKPLGFANSVKVLTATRLSPERMGWGRVSDPHHVTTRGAGGTDRDTVPVCRRCHNRLDSPGNSQASVAREHGVDLTECLETMRRLAYGEEEAVAHG